MSAAPGASWKNEYVWDWSECEQCNPNLDECCAFNETEREWESTPENCPEPDPQFFILKCQGQENDVTVDFATDVSCEAFPSGGEITSLYWSFSSDSGGVDLSGELGTDNPISGVMAVGGTLTVSGQIDNIDATPASRQISVDRASRGWTWFTSGWDGPTQFFFAGASSGPKDNCGGIFPLDVPYTGAVQGRAFGAKCSSIPFERNPIDDTVSHRGWTHAQITAGPNKSLWYVGDFDNAPFTVAQFHRDHRTDGRTYPVAPTLTTPNNIGPSCTLLSTPPPAVTKNLTFRQVNSLGCLTTYAAQYDSLISFTEGHETCHVLLSRHWLGQQQARFDLPNHVQYKWDFSESLLQDALAMEAGTRLLGSDSLSVALDQNSGIDKGPLQFAGVLAAQNTNWVVLTLTGLSAYRRLPTHTSVCP
jgi:hypothetical protein